jgi:dihydrofolate reductase
MAELIYAMITSLDGYIADKAGNFDWAAPDEEVHTFVNQLERPVGTYLYGRRMYEIMAVWETLPTHDEPVCIAEFADIWRAADKVVYSSTLGSVLTPRTRLERSFDPEAIRRMKMSAAQNITIAGPTLAAHAFQAGLVDVCHLFIAPVLVGGGTSAFPPGIRLNLTLQDERRFANGMVYLHYRSAQAESA